MAQAPRFPRACVASPHYLASAAGFGVLASGGNAVDAAAATNLALAVVAPYACGPGGDAFAIVWEDGLHAYNGSGRAPAAATPDAVRALGHDRMPEFGPLPITVPGAVDAWFALLERFGSRSFGELAAPAIRLAEDGFEVTRHAAFYFDVFRQVYAPEHGWHDVYGAVTAGSCLPQPGLGRTLRALADDGPDAMYRGAIGEAIAEHVDRLGGVLARADLAAHRGEWVSTLSVPFGDLDVHELPPNTQGVTALQALRIVSGLDLGPDGARRHHLLIEAMKLALADRDEYVGDPDGMTVDAAELVSERWCTTRRARIDENRAAPLRVSPSPAGGTAYLCAADAEGRCVSLIQSNFTAFGSGLTVPGWGVNLHNRGAGFLLRDDHPNALRPGRRPLHTLIPAMALRDGRPAVVFGTMGDHGQAQTHLQLLVRIALDGADVREAIDAPRWRVSPEDGSVTVEPRFADDVIEGLRARGHSVTLCRPLDHVMGHAQGIAVTGGGYAASSDPRTEGAAIGW